MTVPEGTYRSLSWNSESSIIYFFKICFPTLALREIVLSLLGISKLQKCWMSWYEQYKLNHGQCETPRFNSDYPHNLYFDWFNWSGVSWTINQKNLQIKDSFLCLTALKNIFPEIVNEMLPNPLHKELRAWWNTKSTIWKEVKKHNWGLLKRKSAILTPSVTFSYSQL